MTNYYKILDGASALQPQCKGLNKYRHLFLYAKGYYKQTDLINDLKILVSNRLALEVEFVSIELIYKTLAKCIKKYVNSSDSFLHFTNDLLHTFNYNNFGGEDDFDVIFINTCLSIMRDASITKDAFSEGILIIDGELGLPDSSILPLSEDKNERL